MNEVYSSNYVKEIGIKRDLQILEPLLWHLKQEEFVNYTDLEKKIGTPETPKSSFIIFSENQIYKTYSIIYLMKFFDRTVKYYTLDFSMLLDSWWNNSTLIKKDDLLNYDILIIHGNGRVMNTEYKATALKEIISTRRTCRKLTWIFIEGMSKDSFREHYDGVLEMLDSSSSLTFTTKTES